MKHSFKQKIHPLGMTFSLSTKCVQAIGLLLR